MSRIKRNPEIVKGKPVIKDKIFLPLFVVLCYIFFLYFLLSCIQEGKEDKITTSITTQTRQKEKPAKKSCLKALEWIRKQDVASNYDTFSTSIKEIDHYKVIPFSVIKCFMPQDSIILKSCMANQKTKKYEINEQFISSKSFLSTQNLRLCNAYLNGSDKLQGFTLMGIDAAGKQSLYYAHLESSTNKIKEIVRFRYSWGDGGFIWTDDLIHNSRNKFLQIQKLIYFQDTLQIASAEIYFREDGTMNFENISTIRFLSPF